MKKNNLHGFQPSFCQTFSRIGSSAKITLNRVVCIKVLYVLRQVSSGFKTLNGIKCFLFFRVFINIFYVFFNGGCWGVKMDKCSDKIFYMSEQHIFCYHILEFCHTSVLL